MVFVVKVCLYLRAGSLVKIVAVLGKQGDNVAKNEIVAFVQ